MLPSEESFLHPSALTRQLLSHKKKSLGSISSAQFLQTYSLAASRKKSKAVIKKIGGGTGGLVRSEVVSPALSQKTLHTEEEARRQRTISPPETKENQLPASSSNSLYNSISKKTRRTLSPKDTATPELRKSASLQKQPRKGGCIVKNGPGATTFQNYTKASLQNSLAQRKSTSLTASVNKKTSSASLQKKRSPNATTTSSVLIAPSYSLTLDQRLVSNKKSNKNNHHHQDEPGRHVSRDTSFGRALKAYTQFGSGAGTAAGSSLEQPLSSVSSNETTKRKMGGNPLSPKMGMPPRPDTRASGTFSPEERLIETDTQIFIQRGTPTSLSPQAIHSASISFGPKLGKKFEDNFLGKRHSLGGEEAHKTLIFGRRKMNQWGAPGPENSLQRVNEPVPQHSGDKMERLESQQSSGFISEFELKESSERRSMLRNKSNANLLTLKPASKQKPQPRAFSPPETSTFAKAASHNPSPQGIRPQLDQQKRAAIIGKKLKETLSRVQANGGNPSASAWKRVSACFDSLRCYRDGLGRGQERTEALLSFFEQELTSAILDMKKEEEQTRELNKRQTQELRNFKTLRDRERRKYELALLQKQQEIRKLKEKQRAELKKLREEEKKKEEREVDYLRKELAYQQARENKLIYFFYVLHKREFPVNAIYINEIKDIPTHRFKGAEFNKENSEDLNSFHQSLNLTRRSCTTTSAFSSMGQSTFDQALVIDSAKRQKKPSFVPELDLAVVPPYESSFEDEDDYADEQAVGRDGVDLGDWMVKCLEARPGEVEAPMRTFGFYYERCVRRGRSL